MKATKRTNPAPSARAIQRRRNAPTLARAIAADEKAIQRLIDNEGTVEISISDYRKMIAGLSERGAIDAALRQIAALCDDGDADAMTRQAARIAKGAMQQPELPAGTQHFWIEWNWDENRFSTQADLTEEQARQIETLLETRSQQTQDISKPEVWQPPIVHSTFDEVRKEIVEALGSDTCELCFASLDDNPEHNCPGKIEAVTA
jgi:hypothetical protein